jgi:hypothetical protein
LRKNGWYITVLLYVQLKARAPVLPAMLLKELLTHSSKELGPYADVCCFCCQQYSLVPAELLERVL